MPERRTRYCGAVPAPRVPCRLPRRAGNHSERVGAADWSGPTNLSAMGARRTGTDRDVCGAGDSLPDGRRARIGTSPSNRVMQCK